MKGPGKHEASIILSSSDTLDGFGPPLIFGDFTWIQKLQHPACFNQIVPMHKLRGALLTELAGDLFLREQVVGVHRPLEVLLQDGQDGGLFLRLPHTSRQQHVP